MDILSIAAGSFAAGVSCLSGRYVVKETETGREGLNLLRAGYGAVVVGPRLEDGTPAEMVAEIHRLQPQVPVLVLARDGDTAAGFELAAAGASAVLPVDASPEEIAGALDRAAHGGEEPDTGEPQWRRLLVGRSPAMQTVAEVVRLVGPRRCTVLITGETGTGKEVVARAIHMAGSRAHAAMVSVNCAALPEQLLEAELFGHVRGAFTGAATHRVGRFEQAHKGTLFLDEIGDMPVELQSKLLRVLQEREFQRLGSSETVHLDVRFIAASNADLEGAIEDGSFRQDLFYRLNVVPVRLPPLRERPEDIPMLAHHFVDKVCAADDLPLKRISPEALDVLAGYDWPGNVRQLENAIETAVILSGERTLLGAADFPITNTKRRNVRAAQHVLPFVAVPDHGLDFERTVGRIEREILEQALQKTKGNKKRAAEMLRLKRTTLAAKLKSLEALAG